MLYTNYIHILSNSKPNNHHTPHFIKTLNNILSTKSYEIIVELFNEDNLTYNIKTINSTILEKFIDNKDDRNTLNNLIEQHLNTGGYEFDIKIYF